MCICVCVSSVTMQPGDQLSRYYDNFTLKLEGMQVMVANPGTISQDAYHTCVCTQ